jgi:SNF2 family DNA or RNA helicase
MNVERVCKNAGYLIPMTGTPVPNRPIEMWSILHMLTLKGKYEGKFAESHRFENEYLGWASTPTNAKFMPGAYDRLIDNVKDMVLRRRKDEVLLDLPDKIREVRFVELQGAQRDAYEQMRNEFFIWLDEQKTDYVGTQNMLAQMTYLRQIALLPAGVTLKGQNGEEDRHLDIWESAKIDDAIGIIEDLLEADEKVLVFSNFNAPLKYLLQRVHDLRATTDVAGAHSRQEIETGLIIGGVDEKKRDVIAARFADPSDPMMVVAGNIAAMGVGLNLQGACSHAIFLDLFWNPGVNEQAEDRIHRQGQRSNVTIHIIQAENTIDGFIAKKIEDKAMMIEGMIERDELRQALKDGLI